MRHPVSGSSTPIPTPTLAPSPGSPASLHGFSRGLACLQLPLHVEAAIFDPQKVSSQATRPTPATPNPPFPGSLTSQRDKVKGTIKGNELMCLNVAPSFLPSFFFFSFFPNETTNIFLVVLSVSAAFYLPWPAPKLLGRPYQGRDFSLCQFRFLLLPHFLPPHPPPSAVPAHRKEPKSHIFILGTRHGHGNCCNLSVV